jgi:hypothetical protein
MAADAAAGLALCLGGCGGATGLMQATPISVMVPASVTVMPGGMSVIVEISIVSTSETALVMFVGLPGGVEEKYSASDTNPSGILTFTAGSSTAAGSYPVIVTVSSAGQTASTSFTLIVTKS